MVCKRKAAGPKETLRTGDSPMEMTRLNRADRSLIQRERAIPGLATVLDAPALLRQVGGLLPFLEPVSARISYVRYKPSTSCLVACHVTSGDTNCLILATAYLRGDWQLRRTNHLQRFGSREEDRSPRIFDDLALTVSSFPQDRILPSLGHLHDRCNQKVLLTKLLPNRPALIEPQIETLAYKPERRYVGRLTEQGVPVAVIKLYSAAGYERARKTSKAFTSQVALHVPERLGRSNRHRAVSFGWSAGRMLHELFRQGAEATESIELVANSLAELHERSTDKLNIRTRKAVAESIASVGDYIACLNPPLGETAEEIGRRLVSHLKRQPEVRRPIHGDFYAKQVVAQRGRVAILDFDSAVLDDPAADLGNFIAHLEADDLLERLSPARSAEIRHAFMAEYERVTSDRQVLGRVELQTAMALFKLAPHPFRRREPNWPEQTAAILQRVDELLCNRSSGYRHIPSAGSIE